MPPLLQQEKAILARLASEQEEIRRLAAVQRAAQVERKKMLIQQREIREIQVNRGGFSRFNFLKTIFILKHNIVF